MDGSTIFLLFLLGFTVVIAFTLYSRRRRDHRMVSSHRTRSQAAPGAEGRSEVDHDQSERAPMQHGTR